MMSSEPAAKSEKWKGWTAGCWGTLIVGVLLFTWLAVAMSRTVQVRYFFPSAAFTEEELGLIKTRVDGHLKANYRRKDGKSSGSTRVLEPLPARSEKSGGPCLFHRIDRRERILHRSVRRARFSPMEGRIGIPV